MFGHPDGVRFDHHAQAPAQCHCCGRRDTVLVQWNAYRPQESRRWCCGVCAYSWPVGDVLLEPDPSAPVRQVVVDPPAPVHAIQADPAMLKVQLQAAIADIRKYERRLQNARSEQRRSYQTWRERWSIAVGTYAVNFRETYADDAYYFEAIEPYTWREDPQ